MGEYFWVGEAQLGTGFLVLVLRHDSLSFGNRDQAEPRWPGGFAELGDAGAVHTWIIDAAAKHLGTGRCEEKYRGCCSDFHLLEAALRSFL